MKKSILSVLLGFLLMTSCVEADDVWKYKVTGAVANQEHVFVNYDILLNGAVYFSDSIQLDTSEFTGKTVNQKKSYADGKIKDKCYPIISAENEVKILTSVIGTEVVITVP